MSDGTAPPSKADPLTFNGAKNNFLSNDEFEATGKPSKSDLSNAKSSKKSGADKTIKSIPNGDVVTTKEDGKSNEDEEEEEDSDAEVDLSKLAIVEGMECKTKQLYLAMENHESGEQEWADRMPMAMSMKAAASTAKERERAKFAVLVRMELRPSTRFMADDPVQIHSVVIQSPLIRKVLEKVFEDHPDMNSSQSRLSFDKPLKPFVHRWAALQRALEEEADAETKSHLDLLVSAVEPEVEGIISTRDLCISKDAIAWDQLWMIFEPGTLVTSVRDKSDCAFRLVKAETRKNDRGAWFVLECVFNDWDGEDFGKASVILAIANYSGSSKISELDIIPLQVHQARENLVQNLEERGQRFQELADVKYMVYSGTAIDRSNPSEPRKLFVDGRIVIDADGYIRFNPGEEVMIAPWKNSGADLQEVDMWTKRYQRDRYFSQYEKEKKSQKTELTHDQVLMCRHLVRGFSLKLKRWLDFEIDGVKEVKWNNYAFERLILPNDHKELLLAFAKGQRDSTEEFDDIIEGKGKGLIIQLNGPPGVGKTLTAEAVAETMRVPLYTISAGDLGLEPDRVQLELSTAFQLARNWSAVLLLDEADVFMEKRATNDLARNQLVSLFLQSLEYYQGTLFLTTNRVETIDPAFESRIHISIKYDELTAASRREVWRTFLKIGRGAHGDAAAAAATDHISSAEIDEFVRYDMNGRQIKNVVKSAGLLAMSDGGPLLAKHVRTVLRIKAFDGEGRRKSGAGNNDEGQSPVVVRARRS